MLIKKEDIPKVSNMDMNIIHEVEVELVNKLYDALKENKLEDVEKLFEEFLKEVEDHFSEEEEMMVESGYWARAMHKAEHDTMREKLNNLYENWKNNKNPQEVINFLETEYAPWLNLHISRWDSETAMHIGDSI
ncbi:MAG: bacteriohemerythrin [Hydrogenothermus sp.]|nr:MAG: bacteriohemerythrin [Hydrogenothermus sp.]